MRLRRLTYKLEARAIYLVIFIAFISAVLLLFFISKNYYVKVETLQYEYRKKLVNLANSGIQYSLNQSENISSSLAEIEVLETEGVKGDLSIENWGVYSLSVIQTRWKNLSYSKQALTGNQLFDEERTGLVLADQGKYLSIAGNTELTGVCHLPALGIRSVYIDGTPYKGTSLIYGSRKTSSKELPSISQHCVDFIELANNRELGDSIAYVNDLFRKESISQSFEDKSILYQSNTAIELSGISIDGKIIIQSDSLIILKKSAQINNAIIIAKQIIVEEGFEGCVQLIASDSLFMDKDVTLTYPSAVLCYNDAGNKAFCYLSEGARVEGGLLCSAGASEGKDAELYFESGSVVDGLVYCSGSVQHKGLVYGSMYVGKFVLRTKRGFYENHLHDAVINPQKQYAGLLVPCFLESDKNRGVAAWVR